MMNALALNPKTMLMAGLLAIAPVTLSSSVQATPTTTPVAQASSQTPALDVLTPLNPNPDRLALPETVKIDLNQPLTLEQAIEVAIRNNIGLQISELQLQQARAQLRQVQAQLYPTLAFQASIGQNTSPGGQPAYLPLNFQQQLSLQQQQQQQAQQQLLTQQLAASRILNTQVQRLQQRFQGPQLTAFSDQQNLELQQQLQQLQNSASQAATPSNFTPITLAPVNQLNFTNFFTNLFGATSGATSNAVLVMNYTLFAGGGRSAAIAAARNQVRFSELEVQRQRQQLILEVTNDYYLAQQAKVQVQIAEAAVTNAQVTLRDAKAFEQAGIGTLLDVLTAEVNLANAQQNLSQARHLEITTRRQLAQRLNVNQTVDVAIADRVEPAEEWSLSLEDSILLAYQNRVELEQRLLQRTIALNNRQVVLAATRPQLSLFASGNLLDKITDDLAPRFGYGVGLQMQLALFDGGNARASAARQEALAATAEEQYANQKNIIRLEVETAYTNLRANEKNIATARTAVTQATEGLRLARLRFQAGVGTQQEVTNAETNLTQAQGNLLAAILNYNRSLAALKRAVGYPEQTRLGARQ
ncbi:TolC family protein [Thermosynechococcus sp. JY1334]|uniref:TolC family protein n=1 Tax=unclassified Thermosynechococcus TaxID=2622553 RepID=UPI0026738541|nr:MULTISPECIES: TolC family protein [unclassified Thermosynechococcus]MDR7897088.1 TolC family protein [Thermosynechococcus sp. JY1332]MDR7904486.1 TolC family protein [Thermosynechococcus sp. JY1334]WKT86726.1 TolC family protein [Thermosynechococcus sp. JY1339]WNC55670.1 TolC family protein [Thermosynechococcus sp. JY1331]